MAGEAVVFGFNGVLHRNTGSYASPTWSACTNVRNCRLKYEPQEVDVTRRASGGFVETETGLVAASIEFDVLYVKDENGALPGDVDAFLDAATAKTTIEILCLDDAVADDGARGLRATCKLFGMDRGEQLTEGMTLTFTAKPTYAANPPSWFLTPEGS